MKTRSILLALTIMLFYSCSSIYQSQGNSSIELIEETKNDIAKSAKSFEGQHKSILLQSWGAPKSKTDDGLGGEIYYYSKSVNLSAGTMAVYINMYINKEGKIYKTDVKHLLI
ncbi:hypothetical protein [Pedobacter sp. MW01-1-1]|uniref:hypothetical protein n=1 Tax=Pedobacter sp. MW01-1-1 TaxID=3383027 RepID=UPI003FEE5091